jgi:hypothetical protein
MSDPNLPAEQQPAGTPPQPSVPPGAPRSPDTPDPGDGALVGGDALDIAGTVDMLAAALRADASDLETYERVLVSTFADALPAGMVEVDRERSLGDRMAGRPGKVVAIRIHLGETTLELRSGRGGLTGLLSRGVRGVTISRQEVPVAQWTELLAQHLHAQAQQNAAARAALGRLLGAE